MTKTKAQPKFLSARLAIVAFAIVAAAQCGDMSYARPASVRLIDNGELTFGSFMVFGSGARSVSATGTVIDESVVALEGIRPRPARFTIQFDRGNESRRKMNVDVELVISAPTRIRQGGVEARLSRFETDLPGNVRVSAGEAIRVRLDNCRARLCSRSFNLGGRLDVARNYGGANVSIPINIDARLIAIERP